MAAKYKNKAAKDDFEDWCFVCKDGGGRIRSCDYPECLKGYHHRCVGKKESFLDSKKDWDCPWHKCFSCRKSPDLRCYMCTRASCHNCLPDANILRVKGLHGFCEECLKLVLLVEERKEYDSDGDSLDFTDIRTQEGLFIEYYKIIKKNERFKLADIYTAKKAVDAKKNHQFKTDSEDSDQEHEGHISDCSDTDDEERKHQKRRKSSSRQKPTRSNKKDHESESDSEDFVQENEEQISDCSDTDSEKSKHRKRRKSSSRQKPTRSNKKEFTGWASRSLTEFLKTIGKCTTEKRSQVDVTAIVHDYAKKNKLVRMEKRKVIMCDDQLRSLFGRKAINKSRVYDHLDGHFAEDKNELEDEVGYDLEDGIVAGTLNSSKRQRKMSTEKQTKEKETENNAVPIESLFASIVVENVKLVYLKRSVLKEMLKESQSFEEKVTGCFVRFKPSKSYQLIQVKGVKVFSTDEKETILLLSAEPKEIQVSLLSDDDFDENEFEVLKRKVVAGEIERPTVEYLQQKARSLHKDMINVMIRKELHVLPHLIDRANEKGWRYKLAEYRERLKVLKSGTEHTRLLQNVPMVIPDVYGPAAYCNSEGKKGYAKSDEGRQDKNKSEASPSEKGEPIAENHVSAEAQEGFTPEFDAEGIKVVDVMTEDESVSDDDSPTPKLEVWHYKGPGGERGESPLFILRQWYENTSGLFASKFMVWKKDEREEGAIPLPEALGTTRG